MPTKIWWSREQKREYFRSRKASRRVRELEDELESIKNPPLPKPMFSEISIDCKYK